MKRYQACDCFGMEALCTDCGGTGKVPTNNSAIVITAIICVLILAACAISYKVGRSNGFNQGWDKGYIRGLENPQNADEVEP